MSRFDGLRASPVAVALAGGLMLALAGCGTAGRGSSTGSPSATSTGSRIRSTTRSTSSTPTPRRSGPAGVTAQRRRVVHGPPIGSRQSVHTHGADLTVTVTRVLDLIDTETAALPGTRQVGVVLRIANQAGATYDSTSSGDVSVVVSAGQTQPLFVRSGICTTPLVDFESIVVSGVVRSGCVAFSVSRHARILGVRFSPHARTAGTLSWRVG